MEYVSTIYILLQLLSSLTLCQLSMPQNSSRQLIKIGGVFSGSHYDYFGLAALRLAVDYVNRRDDVLPNVTLVYVDGMNQSTGVGPRSAVPSASLDSLKKACDVVQRGVVAVIGPAITADVKAAAPVFSGLHIPFVSTFASDPTLSVHTGDYSYLFKMAASDELQSAAIIDIIKYYDWSRFAIIASATDYGRNGIVPLQRLALDNDWTITAVSYFYPSLLSKEHMLPILDGIRNKGTRIVILNCLAKYASVVLEEAYKYGMLQRGWAWITTDGVTLLGSVYDPSSEAPLHLRGLIGTRPMKADGALYQQFKTMWTEDKEPKTFQLYVISVMDAVLATAYGIHDYLEDGHVITEPVYDGHVCGEETVTPWSHGELLTKYIQKAAGDGVGHYLNFTDEHYHTAADYDFVNLRRTGWEKVGSWEDKRLIVEDPVMFPGSTGNQPSDTVTSLTNITLRVVTILEEPFAMSDSSTGTPSGGYDGYCIQLLNELRDKLGFNYELYIVPDGGYGIEDPDTKIWNGLIGELTHDRADIVIAPLTISYEREKVIAFTKPYMDLGNIILLPKETPKTSYIAFLDPFSWQLWVALGAAFIVCGVCNTLVSWLSPFGNRGVYSSRLDVNSKKGQEERNTFNLWNSLWFALGQWMMQGAEVTPRCFSGRMVYGAWYLTVMIISATYTANLAAFLTVQRLDGGIHNIEDLASQSEIKYGMVSNTATANFFKIQTTEPYMTMYSYMEKENTYVTNTSEGIEMIQESYGKTKSERYALIADSVILEYVSTQIYCHTEIIGRLFNQFGYGLGLQNNSPYLDLFNLQVLLLRQEGFMNTLQTKWITSGSCNAAGAEDATSGDGVEQATLSQMGGVFVLMILILIFGFLAILCECCTAAKEDAKIIKKQKGKIVSFCDAFSRRRMAICTDIQHYLCTFLGGHGAFQDNYDSTSSSDKMGNTSDVSCAEDVFTVTNDNRKSSKSMENADDHQLKPIHGATLSLDKAESESVAHGEPSAYISIKF